MDIENAIFLIELDAYDSDLAAVDRHYYSSEEFVPQDAPDEFLVRIQDPANFQRTLFSTGRTMGQSQMGFGNTVLLNGDGELDDLTQHGIDGRRFALKMVERGDDYADAVTIFIGTQEQPEFTWSRMGIRIRDRQQVLDRPIQLEKYAGDNELPDGVEGVANDLKGKPKPIALGYCFNVSPPMVNTAKLVFQVHVKRIEEIVAVRDRGAALDAGVERASLDLLMTTDPTPGEYDYYLGSATEGAYFRLDANPSGQITCDIKGDKSDGTYRTTAADIVRHIVTTYGENPLDEDDIDDDAVSDLAELCPQVVGIWIDDEINIVEVVDRLLGSIGAWSGFNRLNIFTMNRFDAPSSPIRTIRAFDNDHPSEDGDINITTIERIASQDANDGLPVSLVKVRYLRNFTVQSPTDLVEPPTIDEEDRQLYAQEWREVIWPTTGPSAAVTVKYLLAPQLEVETLLTTEEDALDHAEFLFGLHGVIRDRFRITTKLTRDLLENVDLGTDLTLEIDRFGYDDGRDVVVIGMDYNTALRKVTLDTFG